MKLSVRAIDLLLLVEVNKNQRKKQTKATQQQSSKLLVLWLSADVLEKSESDLRLMQSNRREKTRQSLEASERQNCSICRTNPASRVGAIFIWWIYRRSLAETYFPLHYRLASLDSESLGFVSMLSLLADLPLTTSQAWEMQIQIETQKPLEREWEKRKRAGPVTQLANRPLFPLKSTCSVINVLRSVDNRQFPRDLHRFALNYSIKATVKRLCKASRVKDLNWVGSPENLFGTHKLSRLRKLNKVGSMQCIKSWFSRCSNKS